MFSPNQEENTLSDSTNKLEENVSTSQNETDPVSQTPVSPKLTEDSQKNEKEQGDNIKWYVLRVQSNKEDKVKASLESRIRNTEGMEKQILQVEVPSERVSEIRKNSNRVVRRKLYPGYVMIQMNKNEDTHYFVRSTPGVGDFAGEMSENEVQRMLMACDNKEDKPKPKVTFWKGQNIKIKEGAFENYEGIVDDVNEQKGIIKVRIGIFGRFTQVELHYWQVENLA